MIDVVWLVAFTGHRPGSGPGRSAAELASVRGPLRELFRKLQERAAGRGGRIELLTGVAAGADLEAAEVATELGLAVHVFLPLAIAEFEKDFESDEAADCTRAQKIIAAARSHVDGGTFRVAQSSGARPDCYYDASIEMLQWADLLIAVWNGEASEGLGGSAQVVGHAKESGIPVVRIDPSNKGAIAAEKPPLDWPRPDPAVMEITEILNSEAKLIGNMAADGEAKCAPEHLFKMLDKVATHRGKQFRGGLIWSVILHFLAAILAAFNTAFSPVFHPVVSGAIFWHSPGEAAAALRTFPVLSTELEFALVGSAWFLLWRAARRHLHGRWRQLRFATELLRGLRATAGFLDVFSLLAVRYTPTWRRFVVSMALAAHRMHDRGLTFEARKQAYLTHRIKNQRDKYFKMQHAPAILWARWLARIGWLATVFAPPIIFAALTAKITLREEWVMTNWPGALIAGWFPVLLPLVAGAATSLSVVTDSRRRAERYGAIYKQLHQVSESFENLKTENAAARVVKATEEILLNELVEWYVAAKAVAH